MADLNYLDILRRTKRNNCGECGHPTCMAFAAAVAKTGSEANRCPYINLEGLSLASPQASDIDELDREKDLAFIQHLKGKIAPLDFSAIAGPLGTALREEYPDTLFFQYLGREVQLGKDSILLDGAKPEDPRDQVLLYNYISCSGGRKPANNWIGMESMPNSISKVKTLEAYCEKPIAELFTGKDAEYIYEVCTKVGGLKNQDSSATISVIIPVLPMVPQQVLFWDEEPEDGFAAKAKVLFDQHVLDFLDIESLIFSAERLAERLDELF